MRRRIVLIATLVTVSATLCLMVPTVAALRERALYAAKLELQRESAQLAASLQPDEALRLENVEVIGNGELHVIGLYGLDGALADGDGPPEGDEVVAVALNGTFAEHTQNDEYVAVAPLPRHGGFAAIRVSESYADPDAEAWRHLRPILALAAAVMVVAAVAAGWFGRSMTRPLARLRSVATSVGRGDRSTEIPATGFSELDDLGSTIGSMADEIERQLFREQAFSAQVSHQLRSPVTALQVVLETELASPRVDPTVALNEALGAVAVLSSTVARLLSMARGHANDRCEFRLDLLVKEMASARRDEFVSMGRRLSTDLCPVSVLASRSAVTHIVDVLLSNSLRHGRGTALLTTKQDIDGLSFMICDGARIVSDPFAAPVTEGHGIGLKLARGLASAEGASLVVAANERSTGHCFQLCFERLAPIDSN